LAVVREREVAIGTSEFRKVVGHFCTGIVVVTATVDDRPVGMTCQSFVSLSLDPPLILFCCAHGSTTWPMIRAAGEFCVNVLSADQISVCSRFAESGGDKFEGVAWTLSEAGHPSIDGCLAHIECSIEDVHRGGDHDIVVGRVLDLKMGSPNPPLLYFQGKFANLSLS
jgi:3-hydroxy-9,10-secoandrosta-1,3,5(10)-triene-9,17-dione monooxygenase reductase component